MRRRDARRSLDCGGTTPLCDIFICNEPWRMTFYSQQFNALIGGVADNWLTRNIYLREADVAANRLIPTQRGRSTAVPAVGDNRRLAF